MRKLRREDRHLGSDRDPEKGAETWGEPERWGQKPREENGASGLGGTEARNERCKLQFGAGVEQRWRGVAVHEWRGLRSEMPV